MSEKTISQQIGEISARLTLADIDERTINNAKIFLLDCLGCILSGSQIRRADQPSEEITLPLPAKEEAAPQEGETAEILPEQTAESAA